MNMVKFGILKRIVVILILLAINGCSSTKTTNEKGITNEELYRPNFHFSPKSGWMNDPNGMFFYKGLYQHLWDTPRLQLRRQIHKVEHTPGVLALLHVEIVFHMADLLPYRHRVQAGFKHVADVLG